MPQPKNAPERKTYDEWLEEMPPDPVLLAIEAVEEGTTPEAITTATRTRMLALLGDGPVTRGQFGAAAAQLLKDLAQERGTTTQQVWAKRTRMLRDEGLPS